MGATQTRQIGNYHIERKRLDRGWLVTVVFDDYESFSVEKWLRVRGRKIPLEHSVDETAKTVSAILWAEKSFLQTRIYTDREKIKTIRCYE